MWKLLCQLFPFLKREPKPREFRYKYQSYPFCDGYYFSVWALDQEEANEKARVKFNEIYDADGTIMTVFYALK